jgi:hypothetical protein
LFKVNGLAEKLRLQETSWDTLRSGRPLHREKREKLVWLA